jgi:peptidoglycan/xylan/chitin deacetylase (PgdA/CDA1 family)
LQHLALLLILIIIISLGISRPINITYGQQQQQHQPANINNNNGCSNKLVMMTFGDTLKGQITTAKPVLDKYGFKASFFITCDWVDYKSQKVHV